MSEFQSYFLQNQPNVNKNYNLNTNHPLIPNNQNYQFYKKYISIHSEDRDALKYPNSNTFEIELPEDLLNVATVKLSNWSFPANYDTFSPTNLNVTMTFTISSPYNPNENGLSNSLYQAIFKCLFLSQSENFTIVIETGFYNPTQMVTELTNQFNYAVTQRIQQYLAANNYTAELAAFDSAGGYTNFVIVYNSVSQKIWFGNIADGFTLTNSTQMQKYTSQDSFFCNSKSILPDFSNWGLPGNLGLPRYDTPSINGTTALPPIPPIFTTTNPLTLTGTITPRFFYGDVVNPGDNGYWLLPNPILTGSQVNWIECPNKINLMGPAYFYMEILGLNCIDETAPYNLSPYTFTNSSTNGSVNSAFAKIAIPTTPISQWFDRDQVPYKEFIPPAERIRKLLITLRYHNGALVDFGTFEYSFVLEFLTLIPQQGRAITHSYNTYNSNTSGSKMG
jgi:hypothetical protein